MSQEPKTPIYKKPKLTKFGSVKDYTRTFSHGGKTDGGAYPANKRMCITAVPEIEEHRTLISDQFCQKQFFTQMEKSIKPGDVVLDLGSGTGIHSLVAIKLGAKKVYAIEAKPIVEAARKVAEDNGMLDKIEFIYGDSLEIELPEKVDVIISNIGFLGTIDSVPDAVKRFLKPEGRCVPDQVGMTFVPVNTKKFYEDNVSFWAEDHYGFNFSALRQMAVNHPLYSKFSSEDFLAQPAQVKSINLLSEVPSTFNWDMNFEMQSAGEMTGFVGWYSFYHNGEMFLSTEPPLQMDPELWQEIFLPLDEALNFNSGDKIEVQISMYQEMTFDSPLWRWVISQNGQTVTDQCSFDAVPVSKEILQKITH